MVSKQTTRTLGLVAVLAAGFVLGSVWTGGTVTAQAERRPNDARQPVPSGGQLSYQVLKKMDGTLTSIDARLSRIEGDVKRLSQAKGS
jgi:hypothetical protein